MLDGNLFASLPKQLAEEEFNPLLEGDAFKLVRIVSTGQATPSGTWYDQKDNEWVILLRGRAGLRFEDEAEERVLVSGDFVRIDAGRRHRVTWTDQAEPTVWLALHYVCEEGAV